MLVVPTNIYYKMGELEIWFKRSEGGDHITLWIGKEKATILSEDFHTFRSILYDLETECKNLKEENNESK